jgi:hypothetical protein
LAIALALAGMLVMVLGSIFLGVAFQLGVAAIGFGLLAYGIARAPAGFQVAITPATEAQDAGSTAELNSRDWKTRNLPFLRPMRGWQPLTGCLFALSQIFFVRFGFSPLAATSLYFYPRAILDSTSWMYGLPVRRERVLAWAILPCWTLFVVATAIGVSLGPFYVLEKVTADNRYWVADYLLSQLWFAIALFSVLWDRKRPPLRGRNLWRILSTGVVTNLIPLLLVMFPAFDSVNGPSVHIKMTLTLARYLPNEPVLWIVIIAGTPVVLWMLLLRAFRDVDATFEGPQQAT